MVDRFCAKDGSNLVYRRLGDVGSTASAAGRIVHSCECAERAAVQDALLREQDVLRQAERDFVEWVC